MACNVHLTQRFTLIPASTRAHTLYVTYVHASVRTHRKSAVSVTVTRISKVELNCLISGWEEGVENDPTGSTMSWPGSWRDEGGREGGFE